MLKVDQSPVPPSIAGVRMCEGEFFIRIVVNRERREINAYSPPPLFVLFSLCGIVVGPLSFKENNEHQKVFICTSFNYYLHGEINF